MINIGPTKRTNNCRYGITCHGCISTSPCIEEYNEEIKPGEDFLILPYYDGKSPYMEYNICKRCIEHMYKSLFGEQ